MGRLLKFEFRKLFSSKYFYILMIINLVLVAMTGFILQFLSLIVLAETTGLYSASNTPYYFAKSILGSTFSLIAAIFVGISATEDFNQTTIKNIFSKGYSRVTVFLSKYIVSLVACLIIALLSVGAAYGLGFYLFDDTSFSEDWLVLVYVILGQLLCVLSYHAIYFFISYTARKVGLSIALNILAPVVVSLLFSLGDAALKVQEIDFIISDYWIENILSNFSNQHSDEDLFIQNFVTLGGYVATFFTAGLFINSRKEV